MMPAAIETTLVKNFRKAHPQKVFNAYNPMVGENGDLPQPSDVSGVVSFLCGPDSKFINGALIPIDGGYSCK